MVRKMRNFSIVILSNLFFLFRSEAEKLLYWSREKRHSEHFELGISRFASPDLPDHYQISSLESPDLPDFESRISDLTDFCQTSSQNPKMCQILARFRVQNPNMCQILARFRVQNLPICQTSSPESQDVSDFSQISSPESLYVSDLCQISSPESQDLPDVESSIPRFVRS